jgi:hypothetical protein
VRDRAAEDPRMQHAGKPHGMGIFGAARHLRARLDASQRPPDLAPDLAPDLGPPLALLLAPPLASDLALPVR